METSRPASRSPASAAPTCRKSTEPMYESLVTLRRAHQLSARRASMTLCHGCDPRGARDWCGRRSQAPNRRVAIVAFSTHDPTSCTVRTWPSFLATRRDGLAEPRRVPDLRSYERPTTTPYSVQVRVNMWEHQPSVRCAMFSHLYIFLRRLGREK